MNHKYTPLQEKYMKVKEIRGGKDEMVDGEWTDRYETLDYIRKDELIKGAYTISERDEKKGVRMTIVNKDTGKIIEEIK